MILKGLVVKKGEMSISGKVRVAFACNGNLYGFSLFEKN